MKLISAVSLMLICSACSKKTIPSAEVNYLSYREGVISLRSLGTGNNERDAIADAKKNALNVLLFRGVPGTEQKDPLIGMDESVLIEANRLYFDKFYGENRYNSFIMSSIPTSNFTKRKKGKCCIAVDVKINLLALRKDLEQNNIIRKFGF